MWNLVSEILMVFGFGLIRPYLIVTALVPYIAILLMSCVMRLEAFMFKFSTIRYQIYRKKEVKRDGRWLDIFSSGCGWVPYSSRLYKTRSYADRKVDFLNRQRDGYFYRICSLEQGEFSL